MGAFGSNRGAVTRWVSQRILESMTAGYIHFGMKDGSSFGSFSVDSLFKTCRNILSANNAPVEKVLQMKKVIQ